ncbi:beta-1,3-glucanase family protein [Spirosoma sp. KNUC1025]|uniref:beta-1,3-glucanase family protein n=1 Tax=Spirosoma sp. KNUC1025 TaxID=2894082 RepID=UPI00386C1FC9|nr:beta-1,3-glucanase family protein [Spirosoma sp. KNUC1025]
MSFQTSKTTRRQFLERSALGAGSALFLPTLLQSCMTDHTLPPSVPPILPGESEGVMTKINLSINNAPTSGVSSDKVFVSIIGTDSTGRLSYLDLKSNAGALHPLTTFSSGVTSCPLSAIAMPIRIPTLTSARIYFAINTDFNPAEFSASGPSTSKIVKTLYEKIEFNAGDSGDCFINPTNVDFYGISYQLSVNSDAAKTVGFTQSRAQILAALNEAIPGEVATNPAAAMYKQLIVRDDNQQVLRFLAPKSAGYSDWGDTADECLTNASRFCQYLDEYIDKHCFNPDRGVFSFYDKQYPTQKNVRYGQILGTGLARTLAIYTADPRSGNVTPYHSLPIPYTGPGNPGLPTYFHSVSAADRNQIDWGFLLLGNSLGAGSAADWGNDDAVLAIMMAICRGVMHYNDGRTDWLDRSKYYQGSGGKGTPDFPIELYAKVIHALAPNGKAYAFSFDDVYAEDPSLVFSPGGMVNITLNSLESVKLP